MRGGTESLTPRPELENDQDPKQTLLLCSDWGILLSASAQDGFGAAQDNPAAANRAEIHLQNYVDDHVDLPREQEAHDRWATASKEVVTRWRNAGPYDLSRITEIMTAPRSPWQNPYAEPHRFDPP